MTARRTIAAIAVAAAAIAVAIVAVACNGVGGRVSREVPASWKDVRQSAGHVAHLDAGIACVDCHGDPANGFRPPPAAVCSNAGCHDKLTAPTALHPGRPGDPAAGHPPACRDCHSFREGAADRLPWQCMDCHQRAQGTHLAAVGAHHDEDCGQCHRPHEATALVAPACTSCHPDQETRHGNHTSGTGRAGPEPDPSGHRNPSLRAPGTCLDCHQPHDAPLVAGTRCLRCHAKDAHAITSRALFPGHDTCTGCHPPHRFARTEVRACRDCHADQAVIAASRHARCDSCHAPHEAAKPRACATCHREKVQHPAPTPGQPCIGCHPPHDARTAGSRALAVACTSCHQKPGHGTATCTDCHAPHGAKPKLDGAFCARCHTSESASARGTGHAACINCHAQAAHAPTRTAPACASCHATQGGAVRSGHATCTSCHPGGPHAPAPTATPAACKSCHQPIAASAPAGHQQCTSCHEPHSGSPQAACASCHADQASHGHGPKLACTTCHRPHGPNGPARPPQCTTCHPDGTRPGLHAVSGHARCDSCHRSHESAPRADRATCLTCHADRSNHEPHAKTCAGCHPFAR